MSFTITIPQELTEIYDFNKPLYIYLISYNYGEKYKISLSSKKIRDKLCYGMIKINENNSFDINDNTAAKIHFEKDYIVYKYGDNIRIMPCKYPIYTSLKLHIPQEILNMSCVDFSKKVYLCERNDRYFLTNNYGDQNKYSSIVCYGTISLGLENDIELTPNMCSGLNIKSSTNVLFCTDYSSIVITK